MLPNKAPRHLKVKRNKKGRDFLLGDLHGEVGKLKKALQQVKFDPTKDRVFSVGDLIDRGPDSVGAAMLLDQDWFFAVRGNHEDLALSSKPDARALHYRSGGSWIRKIGKTKLKKILKRLDKLPYAISLKGPDGELIGICHAEWPGDDWSKVDKALRKRRMRKAMLWGRNRIRSNEPQMDKSATLLVHGHTPIIKPRILGCALFIDTGAAYGRSLTLIPLKKALAKVKRMPAETPHL